MALVLKDRVKETSTTAGTGTITLAGAVAGFQSFSAVGNGNTTYYAIVDNTTGDWEVGIGTYTASGTTLSRTTVLSSSTGGSLVPFAANAKDVFVTYPAEEGVWTNASGVVNATQFGDITATSAALTSGTITAAPVNATDIVNKEYADSIASGLNYHQPVNYASTTTLPAYTYSNGTGGVNATITANANGALSLGGGSPSATQRVLIKDEVGGNAAYNGVYVVTQAGTSLLPFILTRATDYDTSGTGTNEIDQGDYVLVISGTLASTAWVQQTPLPITVGTTALTFLQFNAPITYTAGTGLNLSPATTFNISNTGVTATTYGSASAVPVFAVNAQGQLTSVTNTNIAINGSAVSGNIAGSAGSVANALTLGTYLTGGTYNGSAAVTATVDATSANTASKVVARDSSGNFSAGTITATLSGSATSATTATNLAGGAANQIAYQSGSGTTAFATAPSASNQVLSWNGSAFSWSAGTISGVPLGSNLNSLTAGTYLTGTAYNGSAAQTWTVDATSANTASKVVARDASGNFSAGTITASLNGNASTATSATSATTATTSTYSSYLSSLGSYVWNNSTASTGYYTGITNSFVSAAEGFPSYGDVMTMNSYPGGGGALQLYSPYGSAYPDLSLRFRTADYSASGAWTAWKIILDSSNYNSYAPTLTGTGASGTWSINVTGSAGSAGSSTTAVTLTSTQSVWNTGVINNVVGMLGWKNYGNSHVIFDASAGTSPSGTSISNTDSTYAWSSYYPTLMGWNGSATYGVRVDRARQADYLYSSTSAYATIYYDYDNTAYYVNPNSFSQVSSLNADSYLYGGYLRSGTNVYTDQNYGYGLIGAYSSYRYQGVFAMGSPYVLPADGTTTGNLYGMAWSHPNAGGVAGNLNSHGLLLLQNGAFMAALSTNGTFSADVRGTIFYDYNNTGYYVDPNGASNMYEVYANNWFRTYGQTGLYSQSYAQHFYPISNGRYWAITGNGSTDYGALLFKTNYESTIKGYVYWDTNGFGLLHGGGGWSVRGNLAAVGGQFYGSWFSDTDLRAPIFYDYDNTGYYLDPVSTSNLNRVNLVGFTSSGRNYSNEWIEFPNYTGLYSPNNGAHFYPNNGSSYGAWLLQGSRNGWRGIHFYDGGYTPHLMLDGSGNGGMYYESSARWASYYAYSNNCWGFGTSTTSSAYNIYCPTGVYSGGRVDGTIFYDASDTAYYVDPNGVSSQSSILIGYNSASPYVYNVASTGYLTFGTTSDTGNYSIKTALENYNGNYSKLSLYWYTGIRHYASYYYGGHRFYDIDGTLYFGIGVGSNYSYSVYSHRAPIFYDLDNTNYYVDPASTSILNILNCYGNVTAYYSSDIKFKENVRDIPNALETVESIGGKLFDWNDKYMEDHGGEDAYFLRKEDFGVIAQDVQKVFPVAVRTRPDGSLAVDYEKLSALAFAAVAELSNRVKSLEARI